jgi:hypothetical protein
MWLGQEVQEICASQVRMVVWVAEEETAWMMRCHLGGEKERTEGECSSRWESDRTVCSCLRSYGVVNGRMGFGKEDGEEKGFLVEGTRRCTA